MQRLEKDLLIRQHALPTLKAKETALRLEIKKLNNELKSIEKDYSVLLDRNRSFADLWLEYPDVLRIKETEVVFKNIAGVMIPYVRNVEFTIREYSFYANRAWVPGATELLKELSILTIQKGLVERGLGILAYTRKKTTQKVNLYEKSQIPKYQEAIRKIKRFLEDEENLSRAAQKIVKTRQAAAAAAIEGSDL